MKKIICLFMLTILFLILAGCGRAGQTKADGQYDVYYINLSETALVKESYQAAGADTETLITELLRIMAAAPKEKEHFVLLNDSIRVNGYQYDGINVELNMAGGYHDLENTKEVLVRAGLVRTLVQIEGVESVSFLVEGQPLCDSKGNPVGRLTEKSFIENSGKEINSYKSVTITLYFTDETGAALLEESRKLYYSSNVSLEQVVIEQLLKGPKQEGHFATLPANAKIMGVTVVDKVCYVNFDETFSSGALNIQEQIPIYSIANSIIENCNISQVQISINGESNQIFRENMKLSEFYKMNRDLIQKDVM